MRRRACRSGSRRSKPEAPGGSSHGRRAGWVVTLSLPLSGESRFRSEDRSVAGGLRAWDGLGALCVVASRRVGSTSVTSSRHGHVSSELTPPCRLSCSCGSHLCGASAGMPEQRSCKIHIWSKNRLSRWRVRRHASRADTVRCGDGSGGQSADARVEWSARAFCEC